MIHTCPICGAFFDAEELKRAANNKETLITCHYCNTPSEFQTIKSSHIGKGYDYLAVGDFYRASLSFSAAISDAAKMQHSTPSPDAYMGSVLAQFRVQTIFPEEDTLGLTMPELVCHQINEMYIADNEFYIRGMSNLPEHIAAPVSAKFAEYSRIIDGIKYYYHQIEESKPGDFAYGAFIAYEDDPQDENSKKGYEIARKVSNTIDLRNPIYFPVYPDRAEFPNDEEYSEAVIKYEAEILYAIDHSNCMLVITDNNIDLRLTNIYSRFYFKERGSKKGDGSGHNLGFVRFCDHISPVLPDRTVTAKNVFDLENVNDYKRFAKLHNHEIMLEVDENKGLNVEDEEVTVDIEFVEKNENSESPLKQRGRQYIMGRYPQSRCGLDVVNERFAMLVKPTPMENSGWEVMMKTKTGLPYTWYRDMEIDGKLYRGVYFSMYREVYSVQKSNLKGTVQLKHKYTPGRIYCFEFEPLVWDVEDISQQIAVLVANRAVSSSEFNNFAMENSWEASSIRRWLNDDFMNVAFNEAEREVLCTLDGADEDKVFLLDKRQDSRYYYSHAKAPISGSDYYWCTGGMGDTNINNYWITNNDICDNRVAAVIYPTAENGLSSTYVDNTTVAVLPKIIVRLW